MRKNIASGSGLQAYPKYFEISNYVIQCVRSLEKALVVRVNLGRRSHRYYKIHFRVGFTTVSMLSIVGQFSSLFL